MSDSMYVKHLCAIALAECREREKPYQTNGKGFLTNTLHFERCLQTSRNWQKQFEILIEDKKVR